MRSWDNGYVNVKEEARGFSVHYNGEFVGEIVPHDAADQTAIIKALDAGADPIAEGWEDVDGNALEYPVEM